MRVMSFVCDNPGLLLSSGIVLISFGETLLGVGLLQRGRGAIALLPFQKPANGVRLTCTIQPATVVDRGNMYQRGTH